VRVAQQRLDAAHRENGRADAAWAKTCAEADAAMARGQKTTPEFIVEAAARARAAMGEDVNPKVIPFKGGMMTVEQYMAWSYSNQGKPK
jgi:hypothetical protein